MLGGGVDDGFGGDSGRLTLARRPMFGSRNGKRVGVASPNIAPASRQLIPELAFLFSFF